MGAFEPAGALVLQQLPRGGIGNVERSTNDSPHPPYPHLPQNPRCIEEAVSRQLSAISRAFEEK
jgi:hypothetical protein